MFPEVTRDDVFRLETERLWLRWPRPADAVALVRLAGDPDVALKTARIPSPYSIQDANSFIAAARAEDGAGTSLTLALSLKNTPNDLIGVVSLEGSSHRGAASFGLWLGKPHWNCGLATEAGAGLIDLAFGLTSIDRVVSFTLRDHVAARRVHEKLGFSHLGPGLRQAPARGGEVEVALFELRRGTAHTPFAGRRRRLTSA